MFAWDVVGVMKTTTTSTLLKLTLAALIALPVLQTARASTGQASFEDCSSGITELKKKKKKKKSNDDNNGGNENHSENNGNEGGENHSENHSENH